MVNTTAVGFIIRLFLVMVLLLPFGVFLHTDFREPLSGKNDLPFIQNSILDIFRLDQDKEFVNFICIVI